jgi:MFS family permease
MVLCNAIAALSPGVYVYLVTFALQALSMGAFMASWYSYMLERAPEGSRMRYVSVLGLMLVPAGLLSPILAGQLVEWRGYRVLFGLAAGGQLAGVLTALSLPGRGKDPSAPPALSDAPEAVEGS